ncbi:MAG: DUF1232 domain-containing protein [Spirochaetota bacterium]|nr:DUF1232 domain-containing protein [Spirochaetota bacterium]
MQSKIPKFLKKWKEHSLNYNDNQNLNAENVNYKFKAIEDELETKIKNLIDKINFINDIKALYRYVIDGKADIIEKLEIFLALLYFINPFDIIPDVLPIIGYIDDGLIIAYLVKKLKEKIEIYR